MIKKISKFFAICFCFLATLVVPGCGNNSSNQGGANNSTNQGGAIKNSGKIELTDKYGSTISSLELIPLSGLAFSTSFTYTHDGSSEVVDESSISYIINISGLSSSQYEFVSGAAGYLIIDDTVSVGNYTMNLSVNYSGETFSNSFSISVVDSYQYMAKRLIDTVVTRGDYDADIGYSYTLSIEGFDTMIVVENKNSTNFSLFTLYSSSGSSAMNLVDIKAGATFDLIYQYAYGGETIAAGTGSYYKDSLTASLSSVPFAEYGGTSSQKSQHQQISAQLLVIGLMTLEAFCSEYISTNLVVLNYAYCFGFTSLSFE